MKKPRNKRKSPNILGGLAYVVFLAAFLAVGSFAGWINQSSLAREMLRQRILFVPPQEAFNGRKNLIVLLLGCDEDLYFGGKQVIKHKARSDMMLLANLDFANKKITGLSIPRDLRVKMPGRPAHKINAFHAIAPYGKEDEYTQKAVEYMLPGVHIDKVLTIDYDAFENLVNMVDGVTVTVDKKMDYDDNAGNVHAHFVPGVQRLDGYRAEMFVRFRHADSDFDRQARQKEFLIAFKNAVLEHKSSLMQIAEEGKKVFGDVMDDQQIAALANFGSTVSEKNIELGVLPSHPGPGSWVLLDKRGVDTALRKYGLLSDYSGMLGANR